MGALASSIAVRVGLPLTGGQLVSAARAAGYPVLFSANAFMVRDAEGGTARVRRPNPAQLAGLDAALDSAGFVAAERYRGYPWTVDQYLDLVEAHPWAWYSSMDYCVEPEYAGSLIETMFRVAETCRMYRVVCRTAEERGLPAPVPVLQGWGVDHYLWCVDHMPLAAWPVLVGVGSMCRRQIHGPHGVLAIVEALDRVLPQQTRLHLFGVKGTALAYLAGHPRIASVDSMAWDFAARCAVPTGRTAARRIEFMHEWTSRTQQRASGARRPYEMALFDEEGAEHSEDLADMLELVVSDEIDGRSAAFHCARMWLEG